MTTVELAEDSWSRDYVAYMTCGAGDNWIPQVSAQAREWLVQKGFDPDFSASSDHAVPGRELSIRRTADGSSHDLRVVLTEHDERTGSWTTELLAHDEAGHDDWILLTVRSSQGNFVAVPRLSKYLMQVLPLADGALELRDQAQVFHEADVDRLVAILGDEQRHGLVFVAGTNSSDGVPFDPFCRKVSFWLREVYGLAQVIVLDPLATAEFERRVGPRLAAPAWTIRTFHPKVRFDNDLDARRHRILGTERLGSQSDRRIQFLLGEIARNHAAERKLSGAVQRVRRRFERLENRRLVEAVEAPVPEASTVEVPPTREKRKVTVPGLDLSFIKKLLELEEVTESAIRDVATRLLHGSRAISALKDLQDRVEALQRRTEHLEDQNSSLLETLKDEQTAVELARIDLDQREGRIRWLESRLRDSGDYETEYLSVPAEFFDSRPGSYDELLDRIERLPGVEFTGDQSEVTRLGAIDTNESALRTAWEAVLALVDYLKACANDDCDGGLKHYLEHTPAGYRSFPPGKFAHTETGITMSSHGDERLFPVPKTVDARGFAHMKAHFKLARIGMSSPRMYVLDQRSNDGTIYIGYIGTHLTNTQTN